MLEILTILAIFIGPISAIAVSRILDNGKERKARQMDIFRTLMRTRRTPIWADHVGALNLVEIEFKDNPTIIAAWTALFEHFGAKHVRGPDEEITAGLNQDEIGQRHRRFDDRLATERQKLLAKLLHAIAKKLRFDAEQLEIFEGGYTPQGWEDVELEQRAIRRYIVDLYLGRRMLPVGVVDYTQANPPQPQQRGV